MSKTLILFLFLCLAVSYSHAQCNLSGITINSILVDPNSDFTDPTMNFNSDGVSAYENPSHPNTPYESDDEFIEICNTGSATPVNISGWQVGDDEGFNGTFGGQVFTFPTGTILAPGNCAVVITQWDASTGPTAPVFHLNANIAYINNGGDNIILSDGTNTCEVVFNSATCPGGATNCEDWGNDIDGCVLLRTGPDCSYTPLLLPVTYAYVKATATENTVQLNWATETEINNDYFSIEHSTDGRQYTSVGRVDGHGQSEETITYYFQHDRPAPGDNYYRLRQVDYDGQYEYSPVVVARVAAQQPIATLYPNPSRTGQATLRYHAPTDGTLHIQVFDLTGRSVWTRTQPVSEGTNEQPIDLSGLGTGLFEVVLRQGNESARQRLLLSEH